MAAFDFPASPTDGQVYTANGVTFVWSAADTAWKGQGSGGGYLPLSGGTLSGNLAISKTGGGAPQLALSSDAGVVASIALQTGNVNRWILRKSSAAELGSNTGSDLEITRRDDAGGFIDTPFIISRGTGFTSVKGLIFPASQVVSADPNALDDSERGNFTPAVAGTTAAGSGTYTFRDGRYTKIGNKVFFELIASWTAHTGTGNIRISGLPFASIVGSWGPVVSIHADSLTFSGQLSATIPNGQVYLNLATITTNAASGAVAMDTSATLNIAGHYTAA